MNRYYTLIFDRKPEKLEVKLFQILLNLTNIDKYLET